MELTTLEVKQSCYLFLLFLGILGFFCAFSFCVVFIFFFNFNDRDGTRIGSMRKQAGIVDLCPDLVWYGLDDDIIAWFEHHSCLGGEKCTALKAAPPSM